MLEQSKTQAYVYPNTTATTPFTGTLNYPNQPVVITSKAIEYMLTITIEGKVYHIQSSELIDFLEAHKGGF